MMSREFRDCVTNNYATMNEVVEVRGSNSFKYITHDKALINEHTALQKELLRQAGLAFEDKGRIDFHKVTKEVMEYKTYTLLDSDVKRKARAFKAFCSALSGVPRKP